MGPRWRNVAIHKCFQHHFQCTEVDIQLCTQFLGCNLIHADELIKTLFISWCDSCAWPFRMWLAFHVAVTTAETHYPLPIYAHIHCLLSINIQQVLMNVNGCHFFHMEEFSFTPQFQPHCHVTHRCVRLPLCCRPSHSNKM